MHPTTVPLVFATTALITLWVTRARAQDTAAPAGPAFSGSLSAVNDYLFRGLSQTNQNPALQAGVEYGSADRWYIGAWGSNVSWLSDLSTRDARVSNSLEVDLYAGWRIPLDDAWKLDLGVYTYDYPGEYPRGFTRPYTTEGYVAVSFSIATLKYSHSFTNAFGFADSKQSGYLDLCANYEFSPGWIINAHAGRQRVKNTGNADYTDWKLGITRNFDGFAVAIGYYDTNADRAVYTNPDGDYLGRATAVVSISKAF